MWLKRSNSQFQMANHRDWGIMGYNDVIVCITVTKSDERVLFHRTGSISSDKSRSIRFLIINATKICTEWMKLVLCKCCFLPLQIESSITLGHYLKFWIELNSFHHSQKSPLVSSFLTVLWHPVCGLCCRQAVVFFQYLVGHSAGPI